MKFVFSNEEVIPLNESKGEYFDSNHAEIKYDFTEKPGYVSLTIGNMIFNKSTIRELIQFLKAVHDELG